MPVSGLLVAGSLGISQAVGLAIEIKKGLRLGKVTLQLKAVTSAEDVTLALRQTLDGPNMGTPVTVTVPAQALYADFDFDFSPQTLWLASGGHIVGYVSYWHGPVGLFFLQCPRPSHSLLRLRPRHSGKCCWKLEESLPAQPLETVKRRACIGSAYLIR